MLLTTARLPDLIAWKIAPPPPDPDDADERDEPDDRSFVPYLDERGEISASLEGWKVNPEKSGSDGISSGATLAMSEKVEEGADGVVPKVQPALLLPL
jgi:hypothetical protein